MPACSQGTVPCSAAQHLPVIALWRSLQVKNGLHNRFLQVLCSCTNLYTWQAAVLFMLKPCREACALHRCEVHFVARHQKTVLLRKHGACGCATSRDICCMESVLRHQPKEVATNKIVLGVGVVWLIMPTSMAFTS